MAITAGAAQVEVTPVFPKWRRKVSSEVTGQHMTAMGRRGGQQVSTGFDSGTSRLGAGIRSAAKAGLIGLGAMGTAATVLGFKTAAAGETAEIAFTTMLGSGKKARKFLDELKAFAAETPFDMPELQTSAQSLVSAGVNANKVIPIMRTLGNVTAGMGTGQEGIKRATVAIQQMQAAQKISGEDLNQLRDAGIPVYDLLAKATNRSKGEVVELAKQGKLGKKDLDAMMKGLESGKGLERFNGMMEKQSKSLSGTWSTLKDTTAMGLADAVEPLLPTVKRSLAGLTGVVESNAPKLRKALQGLVASGPKIVAAFKSLGTPENRAALDNLRSSFSSLGPAMADAKGEGPKLSSVINGVASAVRFASSHVDTLVKYAPAFLGLLAGYKVLQGANNVLGRQSAIGMGLQVASTLSLAASNRALALSQRSVAASTVQATAAERVGLLTRIRGRVATIASTIAERASTAAKKAGAVAQRVLNAVMRMNPLGIVITALTALGVGLVIAYKKSATFRRIVDGAFTGVRRAGSGMVTWFQNVAWPWMSKVFHNIGAVATWLWRKAIQPAFRGMGSLISWWYTHVVRRYFSLVGAVFRGGAATAKWLWQKAIAPSFRGVGAVTKWLYSRAIQPNFARITSTFRGGAKVAKWLYSNGIRPAYDSIASKAKWLWGKTKWAFDKLKAGARSVKDSIVKARDGIRSAWSRLNGILRSPIRKALSWMNTHFIGKLNTMLGKIPGVDLKIPKIPGFDAGGWTGPGSKMTPAGVVHADEFVVKKSSQNSISRVAPGYLDALNQHGAKALSWNAPGYAIGGKVAGLNKRFLEQLSAFNAAAGGRYSVNSGYRSNAHQQLLYNRYLAGRGPVAARPGSSQHNRGLAADLAPSNARNVHGALAKKFGLVWTVPSESWHIEPSWGRGSNAGPGAMAGVAGIGQMYSNPSGWFQKKLSGLTKGFDASKYGLAGKIIPSILKRIGSSIKSRIVAALSFGGGGSGPGMSLSSVAKGTNQIMGKGLAAQMGWTGRQWTALRKLWQKESNWNHKARNSSSGAYGIPQSLPGSKMRSAGADWRTNPQTQIKWGLNYIKGRYRNPVAAWAHSQRLNWYADGGRVKPPTGYAGGTRSATPGPHWVGENGPELRWFRGGERVMDSRRSRQLAGGPSGPLRISGELSMRDGQAYIEGIAEGVYGDLRDGERALEGMH
ncbi:tape measure protein [Janibacter sp. GS2]|uniref:aggregation-promoting factor C-terminal-like domain-containing protein n=1 Tax=Janibacter sp. GS2 TaxID=3442646 RepID=UPI003EBB814D